MRITIIGAGFTGSVLAIELARHAAAGVSISLVGVPETFGRGVAYGEARLEHLLNVRARDLGATRDYPGEFADWLHLTERHVHEHQHTALNHGHKHRHDEHHQHSHDFEWDGVEPHSHAHQHTEIQHSHGHFPDIHHRHAHR